MFIKINQDATTVYPYSLGSLRQDFPGTSFAMPPQDADLAAFGIFPVVPAAAPGFSALTERAVEMPPTFVAGQWRQQWLVTNVTSEEAAANLAAAKAAKNSEINAARLTANRSIFTHAGKAFSCDELSRSDIDGINGFVALTNTLPAGWPGGWKAVDNTVHPIADVPAWTAFYGSMVAAGNANFAHAQTLKEQLAIATTAEQIAAIVW
jgi:hypothetical protein